MTEHWYLAYVLDPFQVAPPTYVVCDDRGARRPLSANELSSSTATVITFSASGLVEALRSVHSPLPRTLIEVQAALRLRSGLSRDPGGATSWNTWKALKRYYEKAQDGDVFRDVFETKRKRPEDGEMLRLLFATATALKNLWGALLRDLEWQSELRRLLEIEIPVQQVFFSRQYSGIRVNVQLAERFRFEARDAKYATFREVAAALNMGPTGLNFRTIGALLSGTDAQHLREWADAPNLRDYFEIAQESSSFASAFLRFIDSNNDLNVLTATAGAEGRLFPTFDCLGTVTGRILVSNPRLQQLRKRFRGILAADEDKRLLYMDYAQFEPAILSSVSGDRALQTLYDTQDMYQALSVAVFGTGEKSDVCKKIFLAYCYGMSVENIARLLAGSDFSLVRLTEFGDVVRRFFGTFTELEKYRKDSADSLEAKGYIGTVLGNRRIRQSNGPLSAKERRWAGNQFVQGSASVIFKQAILYIAQNLGSSSVLLPMHDAVLLQYDPAQCSGKEFQEEVRRSMAEAFNRWVPDVQPKIVSQNFVAALP